jgi:hypothetical protein
VGMDFKIQMSDDIKMSTLTTNDDPFQMAFFPTPSTDGPVSAEQSGLLGSGGRAHTSSMNHVKSVAVSEDDKDLVAHMLGLPFSNSDKPAHHGLPLRVCWEVWVVCFGWTMDKAVNEPFYAHFECGVNGHYYELRTPPGPTNHHCVGLETGLPSAKFVSYSKHDDMLRIEIRSAMGDKCVGSTVYRLRDLKPQVPVCGWVKLKQPDGNEWILLVVLQYD